MDQAPLLAREDVAAEVRRALAKASHPQDVVLYGRGEGGTCDVEVAGKTAPYAVQYASCELQLRAALAQEGRGPAAVLMDYATALPADINCRIATGRLRIPDRGTRLARCLAPNRTVEVSAALLRSDVGKAILAGAHIDPVSDAAATLGEDEAWRAFLSANAGLPQATPLTFDQLLGFVVAGGTPARLKAEVDRFAELDKALAKWLGDRLGAHAVELWRAWQSMGGRNAVAAAVLLETVAEVYEKDDFVKGWVSLPLSRAGIAVQGLEAIRAWGSAAATLLHRVRDEAPFRQLVEDADTLVDEDAREHLAASRYLPSAFRVQCARLAAVLEPVAQAPDRTAFTAAGQALRTLRNHWLAVEQDDLVERAEMAVRLVGWLLQRPALEHRRQAAPYDLAMQLATTYVRMGGFVDLARRRLRGSDGEGVLDHAIAAVLKAVDAVRDEDDKLFAQSCAAWQRAGRPVDQVLPIEKALDKFARDFLERGPDRKLLVLLLDGMSWSIATELLLELQGQEISPLRWQPAPQGTGVWPVLAAVPTKTDVSRSSFFAGALVASGAAHATGDDPTRFSRHPGLCTIVTRAGGPTLLPEKLLVTPQGALTPAVSSMLAAPDRVVACIVNAFDDDLAGAVQLRSRYAPADLPVFSKLLDAAFAAGRTVLLASDHGAAPGARMQFRSSPRNAAGARWRALAPGDTVTDYEVELDARAAWVPPGFDRVALLYRETDRYSTQASAGEHGGMALAEVVAPAILVGNAETERRSEDADLRLAPLDVPAWWRLELASEADLTDKSAPKPDAKPKGKAPKLAPMLPGLVPDPPAAPATSSSRWATVLLESEIYGSMPEHQQQRMREQVVPWVEILVRAGGRMSADRFAQAAGVLPIRVRGAAATMAELLSIDGYVPVGYDGAAREIRLDLNVLEQIFTAD
jgi:hypothetical protein